MAKDYRMLILTALGNILLFLALLCICVVYVRKLHSSSVYVVWFTACFFFVLASIALIIAHTIGILDSKGFPRGAVGHSFMSLLNESINLGKELRIFGSLAALAVLPQWLSYVTSGIFGCARPPRYVLVTMNCIGWLVIKAFAGVGGIVLAVAVFGFIYFKLDASVMRKLVVDASIFITFAFMCLTLKIMTLHDSIVFFRGNRFEPIRTKLRSIHNWMTRF